MVNRQFSVYIASIWCLTERRISRGRKIRRRFAVTGSRMVSTDMTGNESGRSDFAIWRSRSSHGTCAARELLRCAEIDAPELLFSGPLQQLLEQAFAPPRAPLWVNLLSCKAIDSTGSPGNAFGRFSSTHVTDISIATTPTGEVARNGAYTTSDHPTRRYPREPAAAPPCLPVCRRRPAA